MNPKPLFLGSRKQIQGRLFCPLLLLGILVSLNAGFAGAAEQNAAAGPHSNQATNGASRDLPATPLSLADAVNFALQQNPTILKARHDVEAAQGISIQTRAVALPRLTITGSYSGVEPNDVDIIIAPTGQSLGTDQNWASQIKLVQSLYEGGRMRSALRSARLTRDQSTLNYQSVVAGTVLDVKVAYLDVLLAAEQIGVQEASVKLLTQELKDVNNRFEAGTVPRFNVLRAQVELANAQPKLIRARNTLRISKNNLANLLGFNVPKESTENIPLQVSGKLEAQPFDIELPRAISLALRRRTELESLRKAQALRKEDIITAKAGYKPSLQAYGGYDAHNSILTMDLTDVNHGWIAGVQLSWNIFDAWRTRGRVIETTANFEKAGVELDDTARRIELEVRTAYSNFIEARELLESQKKVQEQAEEALRLAEARSEAGAGTQLDVLSAQTALTEARTTQAQALHDYESAKARLERAMGENLAE
jgi:outer membrane protein